MSKISVNRRYQRFTNLSTDRRHIITTQTLRGQIGLFGTTTAGCLFPMNQVYTNDAAYASSWNLNSFNDGSNVTAHVSFNEFDGLSHTNSRPDLASYRYSRGWVSSAAYKMTFIRQVNTVDSVRLGSAQGEFVHKDTGDVKIGVVGLHPTQAGAMRFTGLTGFPNCRPPGGGPEESFANFLRFTGARYRTIGVSTQGRNVCKFNRKYSLRKYGVPGFPLASSGHWFDLVSRSNPVTPSGALYIYIYKPFLPQALASVGTEPEPITPPTVIDFTIKVTLKCTLVEPYLPTNFVGYATFGPTGTTQVGYLGVPTTYDEEPFPGLTGANIIDNDDDNGDERPTLDDECTCPTGATGPTGPTGPTGGTELMVSESKLPVGEGPPLDWNLPLEDEKKLEPVKLKRTKADAHSRFSPDLSPKLNRKKSKNMVE